MPSARHSNWWTRSSALGDEVGAPELAARAGVLTGEAAVNLAAVGEGMVAGDLVNTAARIQSSASPGSVYVGEATRRASDAAIVYEEAGTHELKGKAEPVTLWRATRVVTGIRGSGRSSALEPPFLGRDRELRMLKDLFHASGEGRKAQLLTVIGGAGLGKSRLVWEFQKYIDGLAIDTRWHRGRCLAYGEGVTFWALAEMVRTNASIVEGEDPATALPKLRAAVEHAIPDPEERKWVEPRLVSLLGLETGPTRDREDLFAAWRRFYERLSDEMPTALVFEDIHWADSVAPRFHRIPPGVVAGAIPIFVLAVGRPELLEKRPGWGAAVRNSATMPPRSAARRNDGGPPRSARSRLADGGRFAGAGAVGGRAVVRRGDRADAPRQRAPCRRRGTPTGPPGRSKSSTCRRRSTA